MYKPSLSDDKSSVIEESKDEQSKLYFKDPIKSVTKITAEEDDSLKVYSNVINPDVGLGVQLIILSRVIL